MPLALIRRVLLAALALVVMAIGVGWTMLPTIAGRELDHAFSRVRPDHRPLRHTGAGVSVEELVLHTAAGTEFLHARSVSLSPAFAWPPVEVAVSGLWLSSAGVAEALSSFSQAPDAWQRARNFTKQEFFNSLGTRPQVHLGPVSISTGTGTLEVPAVDGRLVFSDPMHAGLEAGANSLRLEATQDAASIFLQLGPLQSMARAPAPGWEKF